MKWHIAVVALVAWLPSFGFGQDGDARVEARAAALELAGAFANDGFKLRDGHWIGEIAPGAPVVIEVNLYSGNSHWISAATVPGAGVVGVEVFREDGQAVEVDRFEDGSRAAAGFAAERSGRYFVRVTVAGEKPAPVCWLYSYK